MKPREVIEFLEESSPDEDVEVRVDGLGGPARVVPADGDDKLGVDTGLYALVGWSAVDVLEGTTLTEDEARDFLAYYEEKLRECMVVRGREMIEHWLRAAGRYDEAEDDEEDCDCERCDECGAEIPADEDSMINKHHEKSCSLHPDNTV